MKTCVSSTPHMGLGPELGLSKHLGPTNPCSSDAWVTGPCPRRVSPPPALTLLHPLTCSETLGEGPAGGAASFRSRNTSFSQA